VAFGLVVGGVVSPRADAPDPGALATWNMQGGTAGKDSKWNTGVRRLASQHDAVVLQEAGSGPPGSAHTRDDEDPENAPETYHGPGARWWCCCGGGRPRQVRQSTWNPGTRRRSDSFHLYSMQTDPNGGANTGGRVNPIIVSRYPADKVAVVANPMGGRPALGILVRSTWIFNVHAWSGGGNDAPGLLAAISGFFSWRRFFAWLGKNFIVMGDFNRDPSTMQAAAARAGASIASTGQATHQAGRNLDYGIGTRPRRSTRLANPGSDHTPVRFE
jgi:hypothetical protein